MFSFALAIRINHVYTVIKYKIRLFEFYSVLVKVLGIVPDALLVPRLYLFLLLRR